jgi:hypothetical protein
MHGAQLLESTVANALRAAGFAANQDRPITGLPLGRLLVTLETLHMLRPDLRSDLFHALEQRNVLAHRYFPRLFRTPAVSADAEAERLDGLAEMFQGLSEEVADLISTMRHRLGDGTILFWHERDVTLRGGRAMRIYFAAAEVGDGLIHNLPRGYMVVENERTGLPIATRQLEDMYH